MSARDSIKICSSVLDNFLFRFNVVVRTILNDAIAGSCAQTIFIRSIDRFVSRQMIYAEIIRKSWRERMFLHYIFS